MLSRNILANEVTIRFLSVNYSELVGRVSNIVTRIHWVNTVDLEWQWHYYDKFGSFRQYPLHPYCNLPYGFLSVTKGNCMYGRYNCTASSVE